MGLYIEPENTTAEEWLGRLEQNVFVGIEPPKWEDAWAKECLPCCLLNDRSYKPVGIGFSPREWARFTRLDARPKLYFVVPIVELREVCTMIDLAMAEEGVLDPAVSAQIIKDYDSKICHNAEDIADEN